MDGNEECIQAFDTAGNDERCHAAQEALRTHLRTEFTVHVKGSEGPPWADAPKVKSVQAHDAETAVVHFKKPWFGEQVAPLKTPKAKIGDKIITIRTTRSLF